MATKKLELKGEVAKKMNKETKKKTKKTLKTMQKTRENDDLYLREQTKKKIEWATAEKLKGEKMIAQHQAAISALRQQVAKLDGAITALTELKELPNEKDLNKEENK